MFTFSTKYPQQGTVRIHSSLDEFIKHAERSPAEMCEFFMISRVLESRNCQFTHHFNLDHSVSANNTRVLGNERKT